MRLVFRSPIVIVALVAISAGCGATSGATSDEAPIDPLAELLGWNNNASPAEQRAKQLEQEEAVQACMRAEGWEYTPVDYDAQFGNDDEDAALYQDPKAYGEKYGYGVVRNYEQWEEPYLDGEDGGYGGPVFEDPNQEYVDSLSDSEREQYYATLHGELMVDGPAIDEDVTEATATQDQAPSPEDQGCYGKAQFEVFGDQFQIDPEIEQRLNDFYSNYQDDADLVAARQDWLECMKKEDPDSLESDVEGFTVTTPDSMYQLLDFKKVALMGLTVIDYETDGQGGSGWGSDGEQKPIEDDDLEELRRFELALWKVDQKCQDDADIPGIQRRMQQRLADELKADFPELGESDT